MGFLGLFSSKGNGGKQKPSLLVKSQPYAATTAAQAPLQGAYPVSGNGLGVLDLISKSSRTTESGATHILDEDIESAPAPVVGRLRHADIERPTSSWSASTRRTKDTSRKPTEAPVSKPLQATRLNTAASQTSLVTKNMPLAYRTVSSPDDKRPLSGIVASGKTHVDLLDASSKFHPTEFRSRIQAAGARDYGEDVADRNVGENGVNVDSTEVQAFYANAASLTQTPKVVDRGLPPRAGVRRLNKPDNLYHPYNKQATHESPSSPSHFGLMPNNHAARETSSMQRRGSSSPLSDIFPAFKTGGMLIGANKAARRLSMQPKVQDRSDSITHASEVEFRQSSLNRDAQRSLRQVASKPEVKVYNRDDETRTDQTVLASRSEATTASLNNVKGKLETGTRKTTQHGRSQSKDSIGSRAKNVASHLAVQTHNNFRVDHVLAPRTKSLTTASACQHTRGAETQSKLRTSFLQQSSVRPATPTSPVSSTKAFSRPQSRHTPNTSLDLSTGTPALWTSSRSTLNSVVSPQSATGQTVDTYRPNEVRSDTNEIHWSEEESPTSPQMPRGKGEEHLLFSLDGYGMDGAQLPGLNDSFAAPRSTLLHDQRPRSSASMQSFSLRPNQTKPLAPSTDSFFPTSRPRRYILDTAADSDPEFDDDAPYQTNGAGNNTLTPTPKRSIRSFSGISTAGSNGAYSNNVIEEERFDNIDVAAAVRNRKEARAHRRAMGLPVASRRKPAGAPVVARGGPSRTRVRVNTPAKGKGKTSAPAELSFADDDESCHADVES